MLDGQGRLRLEWTGSGTLLEATNVVGPWITNTAPSPVLINPIYPQMFYRVQAQ
jgi:hypothetical protein